MANAALVSEWFDQFSDPYAVLGVSLAADDRRVLKRYRNVAKLLHPDADLSADTAIQELASQLFARMVNPAYQRLKQEKGRAECKATLRFHVRRLNRDTPLQPNSDLARQLMRCPVTEVDIFYEHAVEELSTVQYQAFDRFPQITQQLTELNLVYLQLKMGEVFVSEKRTGLVAANQARPVQFAPLPSDHEVNSESYAQRHYRRAQEYMKKGNWSQAVQELKDAIKLEADKAEYHSLLGLAYLHQQYAGMAKVYLRQALKLNPQDPIALKYAAKVGLESPAPPQNGKVSQNNTTSANRSMQSAEKDKKKGGLFGLFGGEK